MSPVPSYDVYLGDVQVGSLFEDPSGRVGFRFSERYKHLPKRPVLSQSFEDNLDKVYWGKRPGVLPVFFANLLPEGILKNVLQRSLQVPEGEDLRLLAEAGGDLPGALALRLGDYLGEVPDAEGEPLENETEGKEKKLRFSLAGVQLKFSMVRTDDRFTLPARNAQGDWILKVATGEFRELPENEYSVMEWARRAGFDVPRCEIAAPGQLEELKSVVDAGARALAVRRYDRAAGTRVHQEDFAQVMGRSPGDPKYESTYEVLGSLVYGILGDEGLYEFVRRLAFVVASGNHDAHLKNWSLLYPDGMTPAWTPVYDQVAVVAWPKIPYELGLKFAGSRDPARVSLESFRRLAAAARVDEQRVAEEALKTVERARDAWKAYHSQWPLPVEHREAIRAHWRRVPVLRQLGELP
jgi:serine/threonine-protein kinase HipA